MPEFVYQEVFLGLRFIDVMAIVGGFLVVMTIIGKIRGGGDGQIKAQTTGIRCMSCGWTGVTSKHTLRCPKCGNRALSPS